MASPSRAPVEAQRLLLLENIHRSAVELAQRDGHDVQLEKTALGPAELGARIGDVTLLGIRSKTHLDAAVLAKGAKLLAVGCFCIGTNQVDVVAANALGLPVFNAPFSSTRSVAEMVLAEVIALARKLGDRSRELHEGKWRKVAAGSREVRGKTLGIVGYGHIGRQVGVLAEAFGMRVLFHDHTTKLPMGNNSPVPSLGELLANADYVTLHVPETPQTKGMIGEPELAMMRPQSYLLNLSRGTVVDLPALADALRRGHLAGAAVDVYPAEPEGSSDDFHSELQGLPNVLLTPHVGGSTEEAQEAIGREVANSLLSYVRTGSTVGAVNFPEVELPIARGTHRILNVHRNVPGVLRDINRIVSDLNANIHSQVLSTASAIGYLIMDLDQDVSAEVGRRIGALGTSIRTRILY